MQRDACFAARALRAVIAIAAFAGCAFAPDASAALSSTGTLAVPTFESAGLYWQNPGGTSGCEVRFKKAADTAWRQGLAMSYDSRDGECRGSLVHLSPGTDYQVELNLPGQVASRALTFRTWSNSFPVASTVNVSSSNGTTLNITQGGTAAGYVVYQGASGAVLDGQNTAQYNITINASYVIVRGLTLRGAKQDAIRISPNVTDVIIEDNEISGWGRTRDGTWGTDMDSGIRAVCTSPTQLQRVVIQRNKIHSPRYSANSWSDGHPAGPQGITFSYCGGNHVIRHNEIYSANGNYFNDVMGGEDNFSTNGFPHADSDIYGNKLSHAWDDGIEAEGANENVRIWGNYIDRTAIGIATTVTSIGPVYVFRNVWNRAQMYAKVTSLDLDDRQPFFKSGSDRTLGWGRRYFFHNTMLQAVQNGLSYTLGGGYGMGGTGSTQLIENTVSKNNIYHLWKPGKTAFYQTGSSSEVANDMYSGTPGDATIVNGINATPTYATGAGWASEAGGNYQLAPGSAGYDRGVRIPNFNDDFTSTAPDVGAHEGGAPNMKFGIAASPGSAIQAGGGASVPSLVGIVSRKTHATAGTYDLTLNAAASIAGAVTVESRAIGTGHKIVFQFSSAISVPGTVTCVDANGFSVGNVSAAAVGNNVEVTLAGVPDSKRVTVTLTNVNSQALTAKVSVGFLAGDVNGSGSVTSSDILRTKGRMGQAASTANFGHDENIGGSVDSADVAAIKQRAGLVL